jgi:hypothetical protein
MQHAILWDNSLNFPPSSLIPHRTYPILPLSPYVAFPPCTPSLPLSLLWNHPPTGQVPFHQATSPMEKHIRGPIGGCRVF